MTLGTEGVCNKYTSRITNTEIVPIIITGFRPNRSAAIPQGTEVKALPSINEDP